MELNSFESMEFIPSCEKSTANDPTNVASYWDCHGISLKMKLV